MTDSKGVVILLNDSDPLMARVCKVKFEKTSSFEDALKSLTEPNLRAVITEIILQDEAGRSGFDFIAEARTKVPKGTPIITFSDLGQEEDLEKCREAGATACYQKTIS